MFYTKNLLSICANFIDFIVVLWYNYSVKEFLPLLGLFVTDGISGKNRNGSKK